MVHQIVIIKKKKIGVVLLLITSVIYICSFTNEINKNKVRVCLCVIAKDENLYVREFVQHYKQIGYDNIFLYDNNKKDGEHFEEVINDYIENGFVKIIDFRERNENSLPQWDAYKDC